MDRISPEQVIGNGLRIRAFLDDDIVRETWESLRKVYFNQWVNAPTLDVREELWAKMRALDDIQASLKAVADAGTATKIQLDRKAEKAAGAKGAKVAPVTET